MQNTENITSIKQRPLVSFIITYYNIGEALLTECINSILAVSLRDSEREIILVDDGSEDIPQVVITQYGNDITYIRQSNQGLSAARNTGITSANGTYIQFVDGDDKLIIKNYDKCLDRIRSDKPDLLLFAFTSIIDKAKEYDIKGPVEGTYYMSHNNLRAAACGYIFRKDILAGLRFTTGIYHEDENFTPQLILRCEEILYTDTEAYYYRQREDSIINSNNIFKVIKRLNDKERVILHLNKLQDTSPKAEQNALKRRIAQLTMDYLYDIITNTASEHYLDRKIARLRRYGLFPLPDNDYTRKYQLFRIAIKTKLGRTMLIKMCNRNNKRQNNK